MRVIDFSTTSARLAYAWDLNDIGTARARDLESGNIYDVVQAGAGLSTMVNASAVGTETIAIPLSSFREVTSGGDVGDIAAIGGVLASDTTPIFRGDAKESAEIVWASSNSDPIQVSVMLPSSFDGARTVYLDLITASGGTTNAATFTVETSWDGGDQVSDTATGAKSTTPAVVVTTIAAADVPDSARRVTIALTPAAHTTDTMTLFGATLRYSRK